MEATDESTRQRILVAIYDDHEAAQKALERLSDQDFPMDRVSLAGRSGSPGDDPIGVYYPNLGERMKGWGRMGAIWGGLWGLISGAAGMFLIPGVGPVVAAGPLVEALVGAAAGAGAGGGALAGAAAANQLAVAVHRMGVPEERLEELHGLIEEGRYLIILTVDSEEAERWRRALEQGPARHVWDYPYARLTGA